MGFFSDLKEDLSQAVDELMPGQKEEQAAEASEAQVDVSGSQTVDVQDDEETLKQLAELEQILQNIDIPAEQAEDAEEEKGTVDYEPIGNVEVEEATEDIAQVPEETAETAIQESKADPAELMAEEEADIQATVNEFQDAVAALKESVDEQVASSAEEAEEQPPEDLEKELRATFGAKEGEETVEDYMHEEAIRTGAEIIDKSWVLDLKDMETMDETAIITAGMRVKGDILSNGSADVIGEVIGNVQVKGKLNITGKINGNAKAEEIFADSARVTGDMISDSTVKIGVNSVVIGNIEATSAVIAGAVKGTIDVKGPVILDATAVVLGNVRAKSMQINNGARIEGMCVLCYAEQSAAKFFEEQAAL